MWRADIIWVESYELKTVLGVCWHHVSTFISGFLVEIFVVFKCLWFMGLHTKFFGGAPRCVIWRLFGVGPTRHDVSWTCQSVSSHICHDLGGVSPWHDILTNRRCGYGSEPMMHSWGMNIHMHQKCRWEHKGYRSGMAECPISRTCWEHGAGYNLNIGYYPPVIKHGNGKWTI